jgi:hypothetical protein
LARASASIRWFRDRSGAIEGFEEVLAGALEEVRTVVWEDVLPVAVDMGGESTHQGQAIKAKMANSPAPQPEVDTRRGRCMV